MNERLYRTVNDRVVAGVCGGLAVRLAVDPSLVRVLWVVIGLVSGVVPLLVLYVVMAVVVPEEPGGFAGVGPSPAPPSGPVGPGDPPAPDASSWAAQPGWYQGGQRGYRARRDHRQHDPLAAAIAGLVLVALGVYFLLRDRLAIDWNIVGAATLVALGAVVILAALRPRR